MSRASATEATKPTTMPATANRIVSPSTCRLDVARRGAERHPHANLLHALRDAVRDHAVDAEARQQQPDAGKPRQAATTGTFAATLPGPPGPSADALPAPTSSGPPPPARERSDATSEDGGSVERTMRSDDTPPAARVRQVHLRRGRLVQAALPHVRDDADDRELGAAGLLRAVRSDRGPDRAAWPASRSGCPPRALSAVSCSVKSRPFTSGMPIARK